MSEKDLNTPTPVGDDIKQELVNIVNEAILNLKPVILDELRGEVTTLVQDVVSQTLVEVLPQAQPDMVEYAEDELEEMACDEPVEEKDATEEEPVEEEVTEEEEVVEEEKDATTEEEEPVEEEEEVVEEEKEVTDKIPIDGIPATPEDVDYVPTEPPLQTPTYVVDSKALADQVVAEVFKRFNMTRQKSTKKSTGSKLQQVQKQNGLKPAKKNKFLDSKKRDKFGRNRKYL